MCSLKHRYIIYLLYLLFCRFLYSSLIPLFLPMSSNLFFHLPSVFILWLSLFPSINFALPLYLPIFLFP